MRRAEKAARGLLCAAVLAGQPASAVAQADDLDRGLLEERGVPALELATGFVVDRTITHIGAEFVRHFAETWRAQPAAAGADVTIVERPSARWGSIVYVEHNSRPIARVFLYAGRSATVRPLAAQAAQYVAERVTEGALAVLLLRDPDLGREELP
ncbi:MAG TPA: CsgE family curli-type amyloid fiber assembly protein [Burkholderiales bacterium]|nr:CsgE family curli-type amyloid fiber assembly protein [Burkholderiales bacterium]